MWRQDAYQQKAGSPPRDEQTLIPELWKAVGDDSLDEALALIDSWYEKNPSMNDTIDIFG